MTREISSNLPLERSRRRNGEEERVRAVTGAVDDSGDRPAGPVRQAETPIPMDGVSRDAVHQTPPRMTPPQPDIALGRTSTAPARRKVRLGMQRAEPQGVITVRIIILHVLSLGVFVVPFDWNLVWLTAATYVPRMLGMEIAYHRYFAHRAFKTSRAFQFVLALLAVTTGQRGILWWASTHRVHHSHADVDGDVHSPRVSGFWHGHMGWTLDGKNADTNLDLVPDFARYPELLWLNKFHYVPGFFLLLGIFFAGHAGWFGSGVGGVSAVIWGFFFSTALVLHGTFAVNSLGHEGGRFGGSQRYATRDASVNHPWLAIPVMGGGWHNNHHRYPAAARAGFAWWEIDPAYIVLRMLAAVRIVWDLRAVPPDVLAEGGLGTPATLGD
jgi:stearoyl-CoA desaturase (delta-9 desaturase)